MKLISVVTPCYNEEPNVAEVAARTRAVLEQFPDYRWEHLFIDNASTDGTLVVLRALAASDKRVKVIANARNFGHIRSPIHALYQASGDAVILLYADLQDPPELLAQMLQLWERGNPVVAGIKTSSQESPVFYHLRSSYYRLIRSLANVEVHEHFTGFGLYDRTVIDLLRTRFYEPYPYFRGLIADMGFPVVRLAYEQKARMRGVSKNNFYTLYDMAMTGITNVSKVPLRMATFAGFAGAAVSAFAGVFYLVYKLLFWNNFSVGVAPALIGMCFFLSLQMVAIGVLGEYVGAIHTLVQNRPLVVERERINFEGTNQTNNANAIEDLARLDAGLRASTTPASVRTP
ncbi:MAG: glycosyltransferase family 2 protein [Bryobacteraceae bacterium]